MLKLLAMCYSRKEPDEKLVQLVKTVIAQTKVKSIATVFTSKGIPVQNLLMANIDAFAQLLLSIKVGRSFSSVEEFFRDVFKSNYTAKARRGLFNFAEPEATWLLDMSFFDAPFAAKVSQRVRLVRSVPGV